MARSSPAQSNFNAGELSPLFGGRVDMAKYGNGCYRMRGFIPLPQGPARRRSGTMYVAATKDNAAQSWLMPFVYSEEDSFALEFGEEYVRFYTDNGQLISSGVAAWVTLTAYAIGDLVTNAGTTYYCTTAHTSAALFATDLASGYWYAQTGDIYEIPSPYTEADLINSNGTFRLSYAQTGDVLFIAHRSHFPRKLTRVGNTNWQFSEATIKNGPFIGVNPDETATVYASAATGTGVTLTASTAIFTAEKVGTLFLLEQKGVDGVPAWEPAKAILLGDERRSDSNVYRALNAATTGAVKPVHREGARYDGDTGVQWQYVHSGYGIARITAVAGLTATADIISEIPSQAVGAANASLRWSFSAWDSVLGYPDVVVFHRERLVYFRGSQWWASVAGDFENFATRDGAEVTADMAIVAEIAAGEVNDVVWAASGDDLLVGTLGAEFSLSEMASSEVFGPGNVAARRESTRGSRQVAPVQAGDSTLFVQPTGMRVRDMRYSFNTAGYESNDLTIIADHIAAGQITQMAFAQEPNSVVWCCCENGDLLGLTFMLEQDVIGWHPNPIGGRTIVSDTAAVESVCVIPSPDGTHDQLWMIVRRRIGASAARYVEYLAPDFDNATTDIADAVFSDSAIGYDGTIVFSPAVRLVDGTTWAAGDTGRILTLTVQPTVAEIGDWIRMRIGDDEAIVEVTGAWAVNSFPVQFVTAIPVGLQDVGCLDMAYMRSTFTGLDHLEGEEVTILADGGGHRNLTVTGGSITIDQRAARVIVGLPAPCELETMRIEAGATDGTAQGKTKRTHRVVLRLHESMGGKVGPEGKEIAIQYRTTSDPMGTQAGLKTGDYFTLYPEGYVREGRIRITSDQPFPLTVVAIFPQLETEDAP
jgi:hypothetical protein